MHLEKGKSKAAISFNGQSGRLKLSELHLWDKNPRIIKDKRFEALCKSMTDDPAFLELRPVLATKEGRIYAGNMRYRAAQHLGWAEIPAILTDIPEKLANERAIKDNNEFGEWNNDELATLIDEMEKAGTDISLLGLDDSIQKIIDQLNEAEIVEDEVPEPPKEPKSKLGDLYQLGEHRLLCGDATKMEDVEKLMGGEKVDMVLTDPPYGISIVKGQKVGGGGALAFGKNGGDGWVEASKYAPIQNDETTDAARDSYSTCIAFGVKNFIIFGGNYFTDFLPPSACWLVWDKENTGNFADVEMAWTSFGKGAKLYRWLWNGLSRKGERATELVSRVHPTQKPVGLFAEILKDFPSENVLDLFGGSGSTLIACEQLNRKCYMMELDPRYIDVIVNRWEKLTGKKAVLL